MSETDQDKLRWQYQRASASNDSFHVQLAELNNRSRWYSTQLWQVPMAYLGLTGIFLASAGDAKQGFQPIALLGSAALGCAVLWHLRRVKADQDRAIHHLQRVESRLELPISALHGEDSGGASDLPLKVAVALATAAYAVGGYLLWQ